MGVGPVEARIDLHVLLYYVKLCHTEADTIFGRFHRYRSSNFNALPVGFYFTAYTTLSKIGLPHLWNNIPLNTGLKCILKKHIWLYYWKQDLANAIHSNSLFSLVFLRSTHRPPVYAYKMQNFMLSWNTTIFPRAALSTVLRFWLTQ